MIIYYVEENMCRRAAYLDYMKNEGAPILVSFYALMARWGEAARHHFHERRMRRMREAVPVAPLKKAKAKGGER